MKINNIGMYKVNNVYKKQLETQQGIQKMTGKDKLEISSEAKELQVESQLSVERQERVNTIRESVQSGEYKVNTDAVAKKMLDFFTR